MKRLKLSFFYAAFIAALLLSVKYIKYNRCVNSRNGITLDYMIQCHNDAVDFIIKL